MSLDAYLVAAAAPGQPPTVWPDVPADLVLAHLGPSLRVWVSSQTPHLQIAPLGASAVLIGDVYSSQSLDGGVAARFNLSILDGMTVEQMCSRLIEDSWGRYVLVTHTSQVSAVFRDPSGALDCLTWRNSEMRFFAGRLPRELDPLLPSAVSIDWSAVAYQLRDPLAVSGASAVRNVTAVAAGALWIAEAGELGETRQLWRPAAVARAGRRSSEEPELLLRQRVQTCVATLADPYRRLLAEISGGLDSAIVAAALLQASRADSPTAPAIRWINFAVRDLEGDERFYAQAIAAHLDIELMARPKPELRYDERTLAQVGADLRVGLTGLDPDYDADLAEEALDHQAGALVTGQGGDAVFLQMGCAEALADRLRQRGQVDLAELLAHSQRWRHSIWRTLGTTIGRAAWRAPQRSAAPRYLSDRTRPHRPSHPWLADLQGLPAAKAIQIDALVASQNVFGPSQRSRSVRCLNPLLSQPVVELTLSLPSYELTRGGADRALARASFGSWLPQVSRERRSKGSLQAFYGRAVAASLDVLRPWLLDGVLARERLIRIDRLEPLLDPDVLIMEDVYVDILHAAAVEAWVRGWSDRIAGIRNRPPPAPTSNYHQES